MTIYVENETDFTFPFDTKELCSRVAEAVLDAEGCPYETEINVLITDNEGIRLYNKEYRNIDRETDVLSFPMFELSPGELPGTEDADPGTGYVPLGDMVISLERVKAQAKEYGHANRRELAYLAVHSVLHLLGYDHESSGLEAVRMREKEEAVLMQLGLPRTVSYTNDEV